MQYMYVIFLCVGIKNNLVGGTDRPADSHSKYFFLYLKRMSLLYILRAGGTKGVGPLPELRMGKN